MKKLKFYYLCLVYPEASEERENPYKPVDKLKNEVKNRDKEEKTPVSETPVNATGNTKVDSKFCLINLFIYLSFGIIGFLRYNSCDYFILISKKKIQHSLAFYV